ncbi:MAG: ABC transporter permease [Clostridia bacterium]|nr:ABC transporter permease [Clostridia bacterium]
MTTNKPNEVLKRKTKGIKSMFAIFKKELRSYFLNAIGYVYLGVFLAVSALLCGYTTLGSGTYDTSDYFTYISLIFIILIPLLTMRLFAEEKKLRTEQLILTAPVSVGGMVVGKFLAAFTLFAAGLLLSLINFIPIFYYANLDGVNDAYAASMGPVVSSVLANTLGLLLLGAAFIAVGMFISSLTENQLAAAIITVSIIAVMLLLNVVNGYVEVYAIRFIISWVCFLSRYAPFQSGIFDPSALLYFLSVAGIFLFLTARVYDKRRWS